MKKRWISTLLSISLLFSSGTAGFCGEAETVFPEILEMEASGEVLSETLKDEAVEAVLSETLEAEETEKILPETFGESQPESLGEVKTEGELLENVPFGELLEEETEELPLEERQEEAQEFLEETEAAALENSADPEGLLEEETNAFELLEEQSSEVTEEICETETIVLEDAGIAEGVSEGAAYRRMRSVVQYDGSFGNQLSGNARQLYGERVKYYVTNRNIGAMSLSYTLDTSLYCAEGELVKAEGGKWTIDKEGTAYQEMKAQLASDFQDSMDAFVYDHPEIFWIRQGKISYTVAAVQSSGNQQTEENRQDCQIYVKVMTYTPSAIFSGAEQLVSEYDAAVLQTAEQIRKTADKNGDGETQPMELIRTIHDYLAQRLYYDTPAYQEYLNQKADSNANIDYRIFSSAGGFLDSVGTGVVCEGYAKSFKVLCDQFGIPCVLIGGRVLSTGEGHMWNGVQLNGKWYLVDVTWDDVSSGIRQTYLMAGAKSEERVTSGNLSGTAIAQIFVYPNLENEGLKLCSCGWHYDTEKTVGSSCEEKAKKIYLCSQCQDSFEVSTEDALGHDYKEVEKKEYCSSAGYLLYCCERCKDEKREPLAALGHDYQKAEKKEYCSSTGYQLYRCKRCKEEKKESLAAIGHSYKNGICTRCGGGDSIVNAKISVSSVWGYDPAGAKTLVKAAFGSNVLQQGKDYTLTYRNHKQQGTAYVTVTGIGKYRGTVSRSFKVVRKYLSVLTYAAVSDQYYTGKSKKPAVKIRNNGTLLKKDTDYTISYKNNKAIGTATITIKGKGNYVGTKTLTFRILPQKVSIQKVKSSAAKSMTVKWKKCSGGSSYQIQYAQNSKFSGAVTVTAKSSETAKTIKKLKGGKTYYVRIRSYKKVSGKKYYSEWSKVKKVTVKKK